MINKNAILRYEAINKCLASGKGYTIGEIVNACNERYSLTPGMEGVSVKSRQVLYDLKDMETIFGVVIQKEKDSVDKRKVLFSYPEGECDIHGDKLQPDDYGDFNQALWMLESLVGLPYVKKAADTLKKKLKTENGGATPVIAVDTNKDLLNFDQLGSYFNDIRLQTPLKIFYMAAFERPHEFWFQPYFLKQYNGRWYLIGWNYDHVDEKDGTRGRIQTLAIDRISKREHNNASFSLSHVYRPNDIDFGHYFDDIIGVTHYPNETVEHVVMKLHETPDWNRILSKPIHPTQRVNEEDHTFSIDVKPNPELYSTLGHFTSLEVISPARVRDAYINKIKTILAYHDKSLQTRCK